MMNEFENRWSEISSVDHLATRFRIHPDHPLGFFIGYSFEGCREVFVEAFSQEISAPQLPMFENIGIDAKKVGGGICVRITLLDEKFAKSFSVMCRDLAERSKTDGTIKNCFQIFLKALGQWAALFRLKALGGPDRAAMIGLLGELLVIEAFLDDLKVDALTILNGWRGPDGDSRDIGFNEYRIEIKTQQSTRSLSLRISSLDQLDDCGKNIYIVLNRVSPSTSGRSVHELIASVAKKVESHAAATLMFERKIELTGIVATSDLARERFGVDDRLVYRVSENFPRLVRSNVPSGVISASYELGGPLLVQHLSSWQELVGGVNAKS